MKRRTTDFQTIRSEGGLLPPDLLRRVLDPKAKLDGARPEDYGLPQGERLNEVITQSWNRLRKHWAEFRAAVGIANGERRMVNGENLRPGETGHSSLVTRHSPGAEGAFTGLTNDKWSLPILRELGFGLLPTSAGPEIGGRTYAINRFFGPVPVHLVGCGLSLDRRAAGVRAAAAVNPHGLVQEFLNRSPHHKWGIVANGLHLRVLRDNQALSRQSFLEFDLEAMFAGEVYSDFVLLWLMAHATRFAPREADRPETCWLEQWTKLAAAQGTRALGDLRGGVERALQILGEGFTGHQKNTALRDALRTGQVPLADFHGQLLRAVYRLIFLFVAEDRTLDGVPLLHSRDDSDAARIARECFATHYGTARLRELAGKIKGSRHGDLWRQFQLLAGALSGDADFAAAREHLALPALGSFLWNPASTAALNDAELTNHDFLEALRHLAFTRQGKVLRPVDYRNLGAEELGGVYESLLALTPQISADGARFSFAEFAGNERKTSGSYYTPDSLVQCLLDSALDPVVEEAIKGKTSAEAEKAILGLKVCDLAVGSGHFLVGAAHRLARHLARVRALAQGESEPSPLLYQHALRDVIGRCLYGVDINPMAAELCRVSLWLEALEPGKPLSFLDHHIRVGNSLLGATPELIADGLPDEAFTPIEGDDKKVCSALRKRNKQEREGQRDMVHLMVKEPDVEYNTLASRTRNIDEAPDDTIGEVRHKADQFHRLVVSPDYRHAQQVADAWCAAFVWKKQANAPLEPITTDTIRRLQADPNALTPAQHLEVERLSREYQFFHWHLAFPEVFAKSGFDCVLGNPPWDQIQLDPREFFAARQVEIADAPNMAARDQMIAKLAVDDPLAFASYKEAERAISGVQHFIHASGRFPFSSVGRLNTAPCFSELARGLLNRGGRAGIIVPSGIATDSFTQGFFRDLFFKKNLVSLFDFENRLGLFATVDSRMKFCLMTLIGFGSSATNSEFAFFASEPSDLRDADRRFTLSEADISLLNPNTNTCPTFRSRRDAELTKHIYRRAPVLVEESCEHGDPWAMHFQLMFMMNTDSGRFKKLNGLNVPVPLYEAKMLCLYDHRAADVVLSETALIRQGQSEELGLTDKEDPFRFPKPRYWVERSAVDERLRQLDSEGHVVWEWRRSWLLGWRDVTSPTNLRTSLPTIIPRVGVGHKFPLMLPGNEGAPLVACLSANLSSFVLDYIARQKVGGTSLTYFYIKQFPVFPPKEYEKYFVWCGAAQTLQDWLLPRVLELTYTAWDLEPFAQDCGWPGPPFRWDEERRFLLRCELDAAFFHLYLHATPDGQWKPTRIAEGAVRDETPEELAELKRRFPTPRDAVAYIMDTFPIVKRKDEAKHGDYHTKRVILEIYDAMQEAIRTGHPYQTRLNPPPADPRCCHPPRKT